MRYVLRKFTIAIIVLCLSELDVKSQDMIIDLSGRKISTLPDSLFEKADQITELNIGSTGELFVVTYPEVKPLPFGTGVRNQFTELSPRIGLLKNLKIIDLSFNDIVILPCEFYSLQRIEELNLNFNYNFDLDAESSKISELKNLKKLFLIGVKFDSFPDHLLRLDLEELAIGNFNLTVDDFFIERISKFRNLKELYLTDVNMSAMPRNLDKLKSLERLDIRYSSTKRVRDSVYALKKLQNLKVINLYGLPLTLEDISFLNDSLIGVEINFQSN